MSKFITIMDKELEEMIANIMRLDIKQSQEEEGKIKKLKNQLSKEKDDSKRNQFKGDIKKLEEKTISYWYKELMKKLNEKLKNVEFSKLDEEEFIKPGGIGEAIAKGLQFKRTQLRKYFNEIKDLKKAIKSFQTKDGKVDDKKIGIRIISLIPKLAYSTSRKLIDEEFYEFIKILLENLREDLTQDNFAKFELIFEAIIAYHVYHHNEEE